MIYLIRTFGRGKDKTALKIGFTDNIWARLQHYREHNPFFELISQRPGDEILETKLHLFLTAKGYKEEFLSEWFIDCSGVLELFHATLKKIDKTIWKQRNNLFLPFIIIPPPCSHFCSGCLSPCIFFYLIIQYGSYHNTRFSNPACRTAAENLEMEI